MNEKDLLKMVVIERCSYSRFPNALHVQYHREAYQLISAVDKKKLHLTDSLLQLWKKYIDLEIQQNNEATGSVHTVKMASIDAERDKVLVHLFGLVRAMISSPEKSLSEAAQQVHIIFKPYYGIHREGCEAESGHIVGLLEDTRKCQAELTTLGLAPVIGKLRDLNQDYERISAIRRKEAAQAILPSASQVRPETDKAFECVCQHIQAAYLYAATADDEKLIADMVAHLNQTSADFNTTYRASVAHRKLAAKKKPQDEKKKPQEAAPDAQEWRKALEPLLRQYEEENGFSPGALALTGQQKITPQGVAYELSVKDTGQTLWVVQKEDRICRYTD